MVMRMKTEEEHDDGDEEEHGDDHNDKDWDVGHNLDMVDSLLHEPVGHGNVHQAVLSGQQGR